MLINYRCAIGFGVRWDRFGQRTKFGGESLKPLYPRQIPPDDSRLGDTRQSRICGTMGDLYETAGVAPSLMYYTIGVGHTMGWIGVKALYIKCQLHPISSALLSTRPIYCEGPSSLTCEACFFHRV
jgi:hypothetical protein